MQSLQLASQFGASASRFGQGVWVRYPVQQPAKVIRLYDIENCPYCRLVREVLTEINLEVQVFPCPKGGRRYRSVVMSHAGKEQFPWLWDENTGAQLYESADIIQYLFETYVQISVPLRWRLRWLQLGSSIVTSGCRLGGGTYLKVSAREPEQPFKLFSFEASPYARGVREFLCEAELSYVLKNVGRMSWRDWVPPALREKLSISSQSVQSNRQYLQSQYGYVTVPFLEDPNTGKALGESQDILAYLKKNYLPQ